MHSPHASLCVPAHWMGSVAQSGINTVESVKKTNTGKERWCRVKALDPACSLQGRNI